MSVRCRPKPAAVRPAHHSPTIFYLTTCIIFPVLLPVFSTAYPLLQAHPILSSIFAAAYWVFMPGSGRECPRSLPLLPKGRQLLHPERTFHTSPSHTTPQHFCPLSHRLSFIGPHFRAARCSVSQQPAYQLTFGHVIFEVIATGLQD